MWQPCEQEDVGSFIDSCEGDDYACLRAFIKNFHIWIQEPKTLFVFAHNFLKYKDDPNNYSLYVWGYVMMMLQYYKIENYMLNRKGEKDRNPGLRLTYGWADAYPQFEELIYEASDTTENSSIDITLIDKSGARQLIFERTNVHFGTSDDVSEWKDYGWQCKEISECHTLRV